MDEITPILKSGYISTVTRVKATASDTIIDQKPENAVLEMSAADPPTITYMGRKFSPTMAVTTFERAQLDDQANVACDLTFFARTSNDRSNRNFDVYFVPDATLRADPILELASGMYDSRPVSIFVKDTADEFSHITSIPAIMRNSIVHIKSGHCGEVDIWEIPETELYHMQALHVADRPNASRADLTAYRRSDNVSVAGPSR
uniref:Uncharacterized protein n=1 Tax=Kwoniella dejecticola CBS 10117 TaxID=1296121 RepID=A0A1A6AEU9_9TREE|nr:uncharacterized protein I303_00419 [Kwoniella dejecticola CBS 10117]OBR88602.1 hypothetical protein I303_00419 [Kwoniella dejecticola CBS 10117]